MKYKGILKTNENLMVLFQDNLPKKIKDGAYVINLDENKDVGTHSIAIFCNKNIIICFDSFGVGHIPKKI